MQKQPLVSIITITYNLIKNNRKDFIIQTIESVHNQTYPYIEHIIIDGASDDGTLELLKPYEEKGWIKIYSEPDNGIYDAMNKGLFRANGEYITYLNSDDFYHSESGITETIKTFEESDCDFVYSTCRYLTLNNYIYGNLKPLIEWFYIRMPFSHQTLFVKTELMKKLNGFDSNFKSAGDFDFVIRMFLSKAAGKEVPTSFVSYRLGGLSDAQKAQSINESIKLIEKNFKPIIPESLELNWEITYRKKRINKILFDNIIKNIHPSFANKLEQFWEKLPSSGDFKNLSHLSNIELLNNLKTIKLFNLITIYKYKEVSENKKWYFLGIQIFRIKQVNKHIKKYYLFAIPILKITEK